MSDGGVRLLCLGIVLAACGDDPAPPSALPCGGATVDTFAAGLTKSSEGGAFEVTLLDASRRPPDRGDNTFTLRVERLPGREPVAPEAIALRPWMPRHGHGSTPAVFTATSSPGGAAVGPVDLFMPGLWELRFSIEPDPERAVFSFCVEG